MTGWRHIDDISSPDVVSAPREKIGRARFGQATRLVLVGYSVHAPMAASGIGLADNTVKSCTEVIER